MTKNIENDSKKYHIIADFRKISNAKASLRIRKTSPKCI